MKTAHHAVLPSLEHITRTRPVLQRGNERRYRPSVTRTCRGSGWPGATLEETVGQWSPQALAFFAAPATAELADFTLSRDDLPPRENRELF